MNPNNMSSEFHISTGNKKLNIIIDADQQTVSGSKSQHTIDLLLQMINMTEHNKLLGRLPYN